MPQTLEPVGSNSSAIGIHWLSAALVSGGSAAPQVGQDHTGNGEVPGSVARSAARIACVAVDHREQSRATPRTAPHRTEGIVQPLDLLLESEGGEDVADVVAEAVDVGK